MRREFGMVVRDLRRKRGLSQRELARRAVLDPGYYCRAENGRIPISDEALLRIADVLRVSPSELLAAADKVRRRFPYEAVTDGAREAFRKLAEDELLDSEDKDWLLHVYRAWHRQEELMDISVHAYGRWQQSDEAVTGADAGKETAETIDGRRKRSRAAGAGELIGKSYWERVARPGRSASGRRSSVAGREEREAREILSEFAQRYGMLEGLRTPICSIAEKLCHLSVRVANLDHHGQDTVGVLLPREAEIWVSDRIRQEGRVRFTIAHEMWHFYHWWSIDAYRPCRGPGRKGSVEARADRFAAAMLMPRPTMLVVGRSWESRDPVYRYGLAQAFGVSVKAMEWRLLDLGLVPARVLHASYLPVRVRAARWQPDLFPWLDDSAV